MRGVADFIWISMSVFGEMILLCFGFILFCYENHCINHFLVFCAIRV